MRPGAVFVLGVVLFLPSMSAAETPAARITLADAVRIASSQSAGARLAGARATQAGQRAGQARAALLPSLAGTASTSRRTFNLKAQGFPLPPTTPDVIGPIDNVDARVRVTQTVFDVPSLQRWQAAGLGAQAGRADLEAASEAAAANGALAWLRAARAGARVDARRQDLLLASELLRLAREQHAAGVSPAIDTTRASTQAAASRADLLVAQNLADRARLDLARALGADPLAVAEPADSLSGASAETGAPTEREAALAYARTHRAELQSEQVRLRRARLERTATSMERLPRLDAAADWGMSGQHSSDWQDTYSMAIGVSLPVFDGWRRESRIAEQGALVAEAEVRAHDAADQVSAEVEAALLDLDSGHEQLSVAQERLRLAQEEVDQAAERFRNGVAGNIEVINAQLSLLRARDAEIDARFTVAAARVALARAAGVARDIH